MSKVDPDKVEPACDDTGCVLIPDDGNPYNDVNVGPVYPNTSLINFNEPTPYYEEP